MRLSSLVVQLSPTVRRDPTRRPQSNTGCDSGAPTSTSDVSGTSGDAAKSNTESSGSPPDLDHLPDPDPDPDHIQMPSQSLPLSCPSTAAGGSRTRELELAPLSSARKSQEGRGQGTEPGRAKKISTNIAISAQAHAPCKIGGWPPGTMIETSSIDVITGSRGVIR